MSVYDEIGVRRILNASGSMTYIGGSLIAPEVLEKMNEAAGAFVEIDELMDWAGREIAEHTGAEAGMVTTGTAGGILLSSAACLTGMDRKRMRALPRTEGWKREFVMQKQHRVGFDHAVGVAGGQIVEVGEEAGTTITHIEAALSDQTAAILYMEFAPTPTVPLAEVVELAHAHNIPVIVDAAAEVPPVGNLRAFIETGADLVIFSGGKDISGPNDTGILCGRADLIAAARAQSFPSGGIGRPLKVGKEQIVGLAFALRRYVSLDQEARLARWQHIAQTMVDALSDIDGVEADVAFPTNGARPLCIPRTRLRLDKTRLTKTIIEIEDQLFADTPSVALMPEEKNSIIWLNPQHLEDGEEVVVARQVKAALTEAIK